MAGGLLVDPCSVRSDGCGRPDGWPPLRYREVCMSAPFCSAAVHFRERLFEQGKMRGSLPINIWGALDVAAVYLTEHAPGLPWRAHHRGADSTTLSLTPLALHPLPTLMGAIPVSFPWAPSPPPHPTSSITITSSCFRTVNLYSDCHYFSFVQLVLHEVSTHSRSVNDFVVLPSASPFHFVNISVSVIRSIKSWPMSQYWFFVVSEQWINSCYDQSLSSTDSTQNLMPSIHPCSLCHSQPHLPDVYITVLKSDRVQGFMHL